MQKELKEGSHQSIDTGEFEQVAVKVSFVSIVGNLILSLFKFLTGILYSSAAMVSDAVHSASDVFSSIIVVIGVRISSKDSDKEHPYGHERFECVAAIILATVLCITGLQIGVKAAKNILSGDYKKIVSYSYIPLIMAIVSIVSKEMMFWYTKMNAKRINSSALMADAWHHRSDALSSVGALIGIGGALKGYTVLEPAACIVISVFIIKAAWEIFNDAINRMVDHACSEEMQKQLFECAVSQKGVERVDLLQTRMFGNKIYVDIEIAVDGNMSLKAAHEIAHNLHDEIEQTFTEVKHVMVHVNPIDS